MTNNIEITPDHHSKFRLLRSEFLAWLEHRSMYGTMALMQQMKYSLTGNPEILAMIAVPPTGQAPEITLNLCMLEDSGFFRYAMLHELRHLPQIARSNREEQVNHMPWPTWVDSDFKRKALWSMFSNIAMDMALNEDIRRLLTENEFQRVTNGFMKAAGREDNKPLAIVPHDGSKKWLHNQEFAYYLERLIEEADKENPESSYQTMDEHDFEGEGSPEDAEGVRQSLRDMLQRAEEESKVLANKKGNQPSDQDLTLTSNKINHVLKRFIQSLKVKTNRIYEGQSAKRYAYEAINRLWPSMGLPGHKRHKEAVPGIALVYDTSGSVVCRDNIFGQLRAVGQELEKSNKVAAVYSCDTELTRMTSATKVTGGGGTVFEERHVQQIRKDLGLADDAKISILVVTDSDMQVRHLNKTVKNLDIHQLDIPADV